MGEMASRPSHVDRGRKRKEKSKHGGASGLKGRSDQEAAAGEVPCTTSYTSHTLKLKFQRIHLASLSLLSLSARLGEVIQA